MFTSTSGAMALLIGSERRDSGRKKRLNVGLWFFQKKSKKGYEKGKSEKTQVCSESRSWFSEG
jgi:hypothetical protein